MFCLLHAEFAKAVYTVGPKGLFVFFDFFQRIQQGTYYQYLSVQVNAFLS